MLPVVTDLVKNLCDVCVTQHVGNLTLLHVPLGVYACGRV